ncbi:hypothetical protein SAMN05216583_1387 [Selenomonas sp. KH1T6]|nr:hypothetical protein SAMN05216583_1387 [Selenomonas ruminantium]
MLRQFHQHLLNEGIDADSIIYMNFELLEFASLENYKHLHSYIQKRMSGKEHVYLLLDEIQIIEHWEKSINSLFAEGKSDIYLTGSNAGMLSSELSTLLSGRYVEIPVLPLSFSEYISFKPEMKGNLDAAFQQYIKYGGMPITPSLPDDEEIITSVLGGIYNTVLVKDVIQRNNVRDADLLERIVRFLADNIGNPISTSKISGYLTSQNRKTTAATVDSYLNMLEKAFVFYRANRYDIKGKMYLKTQEKLYIVDSGIRNTLLGFSGRDYGHVLENIVYFELIRRGYKVGVGKIGSLEVDFVATKPTETKYFQVSATVLDEKTLERELAPLRKIPDHYSKILLTMDRSYITDYNGIKQVNIVDFLTDTDSF